MEIVGKSKEEVALELLEIVARAEYKDTRERGSYQAPTRDWLFDTYTQCLAVVYGQYEKT